VERPPTSHERRARQPWDASYAAGTAPWDIGRPQPAFVRLATKAAIGGEVLDAGCGTGENALLAAGLGLRVLGVDVAETAVSIARQKAVERALDAEFVVADALHLDRLGRTFDTVLDCGLFHTFDADERLAYVASLASVTRGTLYVLCFRDAGPGASGPHPIAEDEVRAAFADGWRMTSLNRARLHTRFGALPAWLATVERDL